MTVEVKPSIIPELQKYGAFDVTACYGCGLCTASCNLTKVGGEFPRKLIHSANLGMEDHLLGSDYVWRCYYCGQCTETCPREADPAAFMMAARRYAISRYDVTRISRIFNLSPWIYLAMTLLVTVIIGGVLWSLTGDIPTSDEVRFFDYLDYKDINFYGVIFGVVYGIILAAGAVSMFRKSIQAKSDEKLEIEGSSALRWFKGFWSIIFNEVMLQRTLKAECEDEPGPLWRSRYAAHMTTFWGFTGLLFATAYDFLFKDPENYDVGIMDLEGLGRIIGTIAGILLMYGVTLSIIGRIRRDTIYAQNSTVGDWTLLILLFLTGLTGFIIEIGFYADITDDWMYFTFYLHLVVAAVLLFMIPFTKFSHLLYRPMALWIHKSKFGHLRDEPIVETVEQPAAAD
jgi:ferredoxin